MTGSETVYTEVRHLDCTHDLALLNLTHQRLSGIFQNISDEVLTNHREQLPVNNFHNLIPTKSFHMCQGM